MADCDNADDTTLMQKWRSHWNTRDRIFNPSPQAANKMGVTLFWASNISLMYTTLYVTAARNDDMTFGASCFWWRVIAWFLWFQTSYNWFLTSLKTLSQATGERVRRAFDKRGIVRPSSDNEMNREHHQPQQLAEFHTCPVCLLMAPPRSYHCKICNCCVLKRDHHCFFTASCVGFNNQRYFVVFTFYTSVSCAVGVMLSACHLARTGLTISVWYDLLQFTPPFAVIQWFSGGLTGCQLLQLLQLSMSLIFSAAALYFLLMQIHLITRGQTTYEVNKGIHRYRLDDVTSNLRAVFGPYWMLNFLWPLRTLPDGDGVFWQTQKNLKGS